MKKATMKSMKKKSMKKAMRKKVKRVSKVAKGRGAKSRVFRGLKENTNTGLTKSSLVKNKTGRVVSKKKSAHGKKVYQKNGLAKWTKAVQQARKSMNLKGFIAVGGKSAKGQELLKKAVPYLENKIIIMVEISW